MQQWIVEFTVDTPSGAKRMVESFYLPSTNDVRNEINKRGGYVLTLQDGSSWSQLDDRPLAVAPRAGDKVLVTRASLGSYMLSVSRQPGIRVRRIN